MALMRILALFLLLPLPLLLVGCSLLAPKIDEKSPALYDMEEPLALYEEPADEDKRIALPAGGFTGVYVTEITQSLDDLDDGAAGVLVDRIVENSPAAFAGLERGDILLEANGKPLGYPSEWRQLELSAKGGENVTVLYDRAGADRTAELTFAARAQPAMRKKTRRYREEARVGIVVRNATEAEARAAKLGPGGGAVVVGLSKTSAWRGVDRGVTDGWGVMYGDLIVEAAGEPVTHPNVLLAAIRDAPKKGNVAIALIREGKRREVELPVSRRTHEQKMTDIPLLYYYEKDRDRTTVSVFLGIYKRVKTRAAAETRILWIFKFRSGDADRLEEVSE
jgi:hypothetical protein